jgi:hypothetical protein
MPSGVDPLVPIVSVEEQAGLQETEEKELVAAEGRPETVNETTLLLVDVRAAVIIFEIDAPALTDLSPEFARVKSKPPGATSMLANHALASALGLLQFLKAFALTSVLAERVSDPVYFLSDCVGGRPSVV